MRHQLSILVMMRRLRMMSVLHQAKRQSSGEAAAIKVIKLEPGDDFSIIQQEILMMKVSVV